MTKFKKYYNNFNIIFIVILIGVFLSLNLAYSVSDSSNLRVPLGGRSSSKEIIEILQENTNEPSRKVKSIEEDKHIGNSLFFRKKVREFAIQDVSRDELAVPVIIMLGKPGSGKGTLAKIFAEELKIKCVSTGDLLRQHFGDDISRLRKPDDATNFLDEWFKEEKPHSGFVLDMTPETKEDYNRLERFLTRNNCSVVAIINVEVTDETARQRLRKRKNRLEDIRKGKAGLEQRLNNFRDNIAPFIELAEESGLLFTIDNGEDEYDEEAVKLKLYKNIQLQLFFKKRRINERIRTLQIFYALKSKIKEIGISGSELISVYSPLICHVEGLLEKEDDRLVIAVAGPTRVGKSVSTERLSMLMNSLNASERYSAVLHADGFYLSDDELKDMGLQEKRSSPFALKVEELIGEIDNFRSGGSFEQQNVSRIPNQRRIKLKSERKLADRVLIVDGGFILNDDTGQYHRLYKMFDLSIAVHADLESLKRWKMAKEIELGFRDPNAEWNRIVDYVKNERKIWTRADLIIRKSGNHRVISLERNPIKITSSLQMDYNLLNPVYSKYLEEIRTILGQGEDIEVAFIVPTFKGAGVAEATKEVAKCLFGSDLNVNGSCYEMVRDEVPYFLAISRALFDVIEDKRELTKDEIYIYKKAIETSLKNMNLEDCTHVFLNDPYTLGLIPLIRQKYPQVKIIWMLYGFLLRSKPDAHPIALNNYLKDADLAVFLLPEFIPPGLVIPSAVFKTRLNPWSYKNIVLDKNFIEAVLKKYNIDPKRKIILQIGRYEWIKDPLMAVQSFCEFKDMLPTEERNNYQLIFIGLDILFGDVHKKKALVDFVSKNFDSDNIHIIGFVPEKTDFDNNEESFIHKLGIEPDMLSGFDKNALEINAFQRAARLILLPSCKESFPNVVLEAMWKKKPILATRIGGLTDLLKEEYLISVDDFHIKITKEIYKELYFGSAKHATIMALLNKRTLPDKFAKKIHSLLRENFESDSKLIGEEHHERIRQGYLIPKSLLECIEILKSCL